MLRYAYTRLAWLKDRLDHGRAWISSARQARYMIAVFTFGCLFTSAAGAAGPAALGEEPPSAPLAGKPAGAGLANERLMRRNLHFADLAIKVLAAPGQNVAYIDELERSLQAFQRSAAAVNDYYRESKVRDDGAVRRARLEQRLYEELSVVIKGRRAVEAVSKFTAQARAAIPRLLADTDEIAELLVERKMSHKQVYTTGTLLFLMQRVDANSQILQGMKGGDASVALDRLGRDLSLLASMARGLLDGDPKHGLERIQDQALRDQVGAVAGRLQQLEALGIELLVHSEGVYDAVRYYEDALLDLAELSREYQQALQ